MAKPALASDVMIKTPDGSCDAVLTYPDGGGSWPGVILYPDALGLRPLMREMARRLADEGLCVLTVNQFYRSTRPPVLPANFSFQNKDDLAKLGELRTPLTHEAVTRDARAFVSFLDAQRAVRTSAPLGTVGYCMGGPMTFRAAAAAPERIGAGASFHGGMLVTDQPTSPHRLLGSIKAQYYVGIAANDDEREPHAKTELARAFAAAAIPARMEVYPGTLHGWCIRDMPPGPGGVQIYDEEQAEIAWGELTSLFRRVLI